MRRGVLAVTEMTIAALAMSAVVTGADAEGMEWSVAYTGDALSTVSGDVSSEISFVDNLDIVADWDLEAIGWRGATLHAHVLHNSGSAPNDEFGTLQGVDNIEVARQGLRLFEFWVEQSLGHLSVRAGLYDLNSEFYANESAGLLIAPAFGIGSELASTGANGPSIFPSTALGARFALPTAERATLRFAALNANAGVLGDPDGVDTDFDHGALLIGEHAWAGDLAFSLGGWVYTEEQADIRVPAERRAYGLYATHERALSDHASAFVRVGMSDGDTTAFSGGWQAGVLIEAPFAARPDGQFSFGAYQGVLSSKHRANERDLGVRVARAETGFEFTYSDQITPWLRVQPDLQLVLDPGGDRDRDPLWVAGFRFALTPHFGDAQ